MFYIFYSNMFVIKNQQGKILAKGCKKGGLYALEEVNHKVLEAIQNKISHNILHQRME